MECAAYNWKGLQTERHTVGNTGSLELWPLMMSTFSLVSPRMTVGTHNHKLGGNTCKPGQEAKKNKEITGPNT